jgi:hypothetical protein
MIQFEFKGGPRDGEVVIHDGNSARARAYSDLTEGGRLGAILWCTTEYYLDVADHLSTGALRDLRDLGMPIRGHLYESCAQWQMDYGLRVKLRHLGACPDSGCKSPPISIACDSWTS